MRIEACYEEASDDAAFLNAALDDAARARRGLKSE
jgi:hypothetical protein